MLLGEVRSKCEHIRYVPLEESVAKELHQMAFARGILATTAIEGNTLSLEQVRARMDGKLDLPPSQEYLGVEIDNMLAAYNSIAHRLLGNEQLHLDLETLCSLDKQILAGLDLARGVVPGQLRTHNVVVGPYRAPDADEVPELMRRLCEWLDGAEFSPPDEAQRIPFAFIKAVIAHVYLEWIHPFGDGNGRLGRLAEFQILISSGIPTPAAHLLSQHYMATRSEYYRQLAAASEEGGDLGPFLLYAAQGFVDSLSDQIKRLHKQAETLMWRAIVDEHFGDKPSAAGLRQRLVAIALANAGPTPRSKIRLLSPAIAEAYGGKGPKTLSRDLNRLRQMGLIELRRGGFRPMFSLVRGMRPFSVSSDDAPAAT
jgi:Fic family protein